MFKTEMRVAENLAGLTYSLYNICDELHDDVGDILESVEVIGQRDDDEFHGTFDAENLDLIFADMVTSERAAAKDLEQFDKLLNQIIAERRKLGDFEVTL
jgi:hypothetical protein